MDSQPPIAAVLALLAAPQTLSVLAQLAGTAAFCLLAPLIGETFVPVSVRLATAVVLTGCVMYVAPARGPEFSAVSGAILPIVRLFAGAIANGLLLAFTLRLVWTVLGAGGYLAALASGFGMAEALVPSSDPAQSRNGITAGPVGLLVWLIGVGAFLASGADQVLWQVGLASGSAGTVGGDGSVQSWLSLAATLLTRAVLAGAILVGPALVAWALTEATLGLAGRVYPLPDGWVMVLPLRTGIGLLVLAISTGWMWRTASPIWQRLLDQAGLPGGLPT